jgi:hypothetical protein
MWKKKSLKTICFECGVTQNFQSVAELTRICQLIFKDMLLRLVVAFQTTNMRDIGQNSGARNGVQTNTAPGGQERPASYREVNQVEQPQIEQKKVELPRVEQPRMEQPENEQSRVNRFELNTNNRFQK